MAEHKKDKKAEEAPPLPGVASMAQGQDAAPPAVEPDEEPVLAKDQQQAGKLATGAEALEEQQQNPELKDNSGTRS